MMQRIAGRVAVLERAGAVVTGESLGRWRARRSRT
jgi:adenylyl- and sulfurtransferase ThiI